MFLMTIIALYTSRIILRTLGVIDYGLYNVVGGIITLFAFVNNSMAISVQRFFSFIIGKKDNSALNKIFSMAINIHFCISIVILLFAETIGLYLLNNYINYPPEKYNSIFWVYQWSTISTCLLFNQIPYNALIISYEKMNAFAYISIIEAVLQLLIVYLLVFISFDKLVLYGFLKMLVALLTIVIYIIYIKKKFTSIKYRILWDKDIFKELTHFAFWSIFGEIAWASINQGNTILLNMFFSPIVNASRGIAFQVNTAVSKFSQNLQLAFTPQIIKTYAQNNLEQMTLLTYRGTKFSFFMLLFLSLPILLNTNFIIKIWLGEVPEYCSIFCQLSIISSLIDCLSNVFSTVAKATGKIRKYQIIISFFLILNLPFSFIILRLGGNPESVYYIYGIISLVLIIVRLHLLNTIIGFNIKSYLKEVIYPIFLVVLFSSLLPVLIKTNFNSDFKNFITSSLFSCFCVLTSTYFFGINKLERESLRTKLNYILNNKRKWF